MTPEIFLSTKEVYFNPWISVGHNEVIRPGLTDGIYGSW